MPEEKKTVEYTPSEFSYECPYCGYTQGWTDYPDKELKNTFCNKCRKEFNVVVPEKFTRQEIINLIVQFGAQKKSLLDLYDYFEKK